MALVIFEVSLETLPDVNKVDSSFSIDAKLALADEHGEINYTTQSLPPYTKRYPSAPIDYSQYINRQDRTAFLAYLDGKIAGQVALRENWNHFVFIDWIAVDASCRGRGIGHALMEKAVSWAKDQHCPGLALETQDNNVTACQFYAHCGFEPGGFDHYMYHNFPDVVHEIAIFWYLIF